MTKEQKEIIMDYIHAYNNYISNEEENNSILFVTMQSAGLAVLKEFNLKDMTYRNLYNKVKQMKKEG